MLDAIVIGGGIIGATVTNVLSRQLKGGVLLLDDCRPNSGTVPSGGHLKPSWFGGMKKSEYEPAMELLQEAWGFTEEEFRVYPSEKTTTVYRVDTDTVVRFRDKMATRETVVSVDKLHNFPIVRTNTGREEQCRLLVVAAGVWASALVDGIPDLHAKQGVSFRLKGNLEEPLIRPWAPYKQVTAHQQKLDEIWVGDGSALLPGNWTDHRTAECLARCLGTVGRQGKDLLHTMVGYRPYCVPAQKNDPCLLKQLGPRAWLATGAGKSGTIAAGWSTRRILDAHPG